MTREWASILVGITGVACIGFACWIMGWELAARIAWALGVGIIGTLLVVGAGLSAMTGNTDGPKKSGDGARP